MPITRSYTNAFSVVDYTQELQLIPLLQTPITSSGLFQEEFLSTHSVLFQETNGTYGLIGDSPRGSKPHAATDDIRSIRSYSMAHFGLVDAITPADIQGRSAYGVMDVAETEAAVLERKMTKIIKSFSNTLETARMHTLTTGNVYAPNGTLTGNFFTNTGTTQTVVNFALGTAGTDVVAKVESVIAAIQENAMTGDVISNIIGYCSEQFFSAFIAHAKIQAAYQYFSAIEGQMIQRNRAGANMSLNREFTYAGVRLIEVRGKIPSGEAVFVPTGTDAFATYYGPANKLDLANTIAQRVYMFTYRDPRGNDVEIEASSDFINVLKRPAVVVKGTMS